MVKEQHENMLKIARTLKSLGASIDSIIENTGLTSEEICAL
jgi:hypothetical protein